MSTLPGEIERFTDEVDTELRRRGIHLSRRMAICLLSTVVIIILSIGLAIGFVFDEKKAEKAKTHQEGGGGAGSSPSPGPTHPSKPPPRMESLLALIEPLAGETVKSVGTPQYMAVDWLVNTDPLQMDFDERNLDEVVDRYVCATLYYATGGESWNEDFNFMSKENICLWHVPGAAPGEDAPGVQCDDNDEVVSIRLEDNNLDGTIPADLALMQTLKFLTLSENNLYGTIPTQIGLLTNLVRLDIHTTKIGGSLPSQLGNLENLHRLALYNNRLEGSILGSVFNLTELKWLNLGSNWLTGKIPSELGTCINLEGIRLHGNSLYGELPPEIANARLLKDFDVAHNNLSGTIPSEYGLLKNLRFIDLAGNKLYGMPPIGLNDMPKLTNLDLSINYITGNLDPIFCSRPESNPDFASLVSDCLKEGLQCTCCTSCCDGELASSCSETSS